MKALYIMDDSSGVKHSNKGDKRSIISATTAFLLSFVVIATILLPGILSTIDSGHKTADPNSLPTVASASASGGIVCDSQMGIRMGSYAGKSRWDNPFFGYVDADSSGRVLTIQEAFGGSGTPGFSAFFGENDDTPWYVASRPVSDQLKDNPRIEEIKGLRGFGGCALNTFTKGLGSIGIGLANLISSISSSLATSAFNPEFICSADNKEGCFDLVGFIGGDGNSDGGIIGNMTKSIYLPLLVIIAMLSGFWIIIKGSKGQVRQALFGVVWSFAAIILGLAMLLNPSLLARAPMEITNAISSCVLNTMNGGNCFTGDSGGATDISNGGNSTDNMCISRSSGVSLGTGLSMAMTSNTINCQIWKSFVVNPLAVGSFGADLESLDANSEHMAPLLEKAGLSPEDFCVNMGTSRSLNEMRGKTLVLDQGDVKVCNLMIYQMYLTTNASMSGDLTEEQTSTSDPNWYKVVNLVSQDEGMWSSWGKISIVGGGAIFMGFMAFLMATAGGIVIAFISVFALGYFLLSIMMMIFAPFFLLFAAHPGRGKRLFLGWVEKLVGFILKYIVSALFLVVAIVFYSGVLSNIVDVITTILFVIIMTFVLILYRKEIIDLLSRANMAGEQLQSNVVQSIRKIIDPKAERAKSISKEAIGGAVGSMLAGGTASQGIRDGAFRELKRGRGTVASAARTMERISADNKKDLQFRAKEAASVAEQRHQEFRESKADHTAAKSDTQDAFRNHETKTEEASQKREQINNNDRIVQDELSAYDRLLNEERNNEIDAVNNDNTLSKDEKEEKIAEINQKYDEKAQAVVDLSALKGIEQAIRDLKINLAVAEAEGNQIKADAINDEIEDLTEQWNDIDAQHDNDDYYYEITSSLNTTLEENENYDSNLDEYGDLNFEANIIEAKDAVLDAQSKEEDASIHLASAERDSLMADDYRDALNDKYLGLAPGSSLFNDRKKAELDEALENKRLADRLSTGDITYAEIVDQYGEDKAKNIENMLADADRVRDEDDSMSVEDYAKKYGTESLAGGFDLKHQDLNDSSNSIDDSDYDYNNVADAYALRDAIERQRHNYDVSGLDDDGDDHSSGTGDDGGSDEDTDTRDHYGSDEDTDTRDHYGSDEDNRNSEGDHQGQPADKYKLTSDEIDDIEGNYVVDEGYGNPASSFGENKIDFSGEDDLSNQDTLPGLEDESVEPLRVTPSGDTPYGDEFVSDDEDDLPPVSTPVSGNDTTTVNDRMPDSDQYQQDLEDHFSDNSEADTRFDDEKPVRTSEPNRVANNEQNINDLDSEYTSTDNMLHNGGEKMNFSGDDNASLSNQDTLPGFEDASGEQTRDGGASENSSYGDRSDAISEDDLPPVSTPVSGNDTTPVGDRVSDQQDLEDHFSDNSEADTRFADRMKNVDGNNNAPASPASSDRVIPTVSEDYTSHADNNKRDDSDKAFDTTSAPKGNFTKENDTPNVSTPVSGNDTTPVGDRVSDQQDLEDHFSDNSEADTRFANANNDRFEASKPEPSSERPTTAAEPVTVKEDTVNRESDKVDKKPNEQTVVTQNKGNYSSDQKQQSSGERHQVDETALRDAEKAKRDSEDALRAAQREEDLVSKEEIDSDKAFDTTSAPKGNFTKENDTPNVSTPVSGNDTTTVNDRMPDSDQYQQDLEDHFSDNSEADTRFADRMKNVDGNNNAPASPASSDRVIPTVSEDYTSHADNNKRDDSDKAFDTTSAPKGNFTNENDTTTVAAPVSGKDTTPVNDNSMPDSDQQDLEDHFSGNSEADARFENANNDRFEASKPEPSSERSTTVAEPIAVKEDTANRESDRVDSKPDEQTVVTQNKGNYSSDQKQQSAGERHQVDETALRDAEKAKRDSEDALRAAQREEDLVSKEEIDSNNAQAIGLNQSHPKTERPIVDEHVISDDRISDRSTEDYRNFSTENLKGSEEAKDNRISDDYNFGSTTIGQSDTKNDDPKVSSVFPEATRQEGNVSESVSAKPTPVNNDDTNINSGNNRSEKISDHNAQVSDSGIQDRVSDAPSNDSQKPQQQSQPTRMDMKAEQAKSTHSPKHEPAPDRGNEKVNDATVVGESESKSEKMLNDNRSEASAPVNNENNKVQNSIKVETPNTDVWANASVQDDVRPVENDVNKSPDPTPKRDDEPKVRDAAPTVTNPWRQGKDDVRPQSQESDPQEKIIRTDTEVKEPSKPKGAESFSGVKESRSEKIDNVQVSDSGVQDRAPEAPSNDYQKPQQQAQPTPRMDMKAEQATRPTHSPNHEPSSDRGSEKVNNDNVVGESKAEKTSNDHVAETSAPTPVNNENNKVQNSSRVESPKTDVGANASVQDDVRSVENDVKKSPEPAPKREDEPKVRDAAPTVTNPWRQGKDAIRPQSQESDPQEKIIRTDTEVKEPSKPKGAESFSGVKESRPEKEEKDPLDMGGFFSDDDSPNTGKDNDQGLLGSLGFGRKNKSQERVDAKTETIRREAESNMKRASSIRERAEKRRERIKNAMANPDQDTLQGLIDTELNTDNDIGKRDLIAETKRARSKSGDIRRENPSTRAKRQRQNNRRIDGDG